MLLIWVGFACCLALAGVVILSFYARIRRKPLVLCLMYHRIASTEAYARCGGTEKIFTLPADEFERQIQYLRQQGYTFLAPDDVLDFTLGRKLLPDRSVLITFDDGCESVYSIARPVLERHGARGTVFVTTDPGAYVFTLHDSTDRRMSDDELRALDGQVIAVGSHGVSHRPMRGMPDNELRRELADSKQELERVLSRPVRFLGVPGNWYDHRVLAMARAVGYEAVWISNPDATRPGMSPFGLPRLNVEGHLTLAEFAKAISPSGVLQRAIVSRIKRTPGQVLGPKYWEPLRRLILKFVPGGYISTRRIMGVAAITLLVLVASFILLSVRMGK